MTSLLYFDPHPDLNTPATAPDGEFDWMGMAHLLAEPEARGELVELPLAENTDRIVGLSFDAVAQALDPLLADAQLGCLTITELNPHHGEPDGATLRPFVARLASALYPRQAGPDGVLG